MSLLRTPSPPPSESNVPQQRAPSVEVRVPTPPPAPRVPLKADSMNSYERRLEREARYKESNETDPSYETFVEEARLRKARADHFVERKHALEARLAENDARSHALRGELNAIAKENHKLLGAIEKHARDAKGEEKLVRRDERVQKVFEKYLTLETDDGDINMDVSEGSDEEI